MDESNARKFGNIIRELSELHLNLELKRVKDDSSLVFLALDKEYKRIVDHLLKGKDEEWRREFFEQMRFSIQQIQEKKRREAVQIEAEKMKLMEALMANRIDVCSDVHLGTAGARKEEFYDWLSSRRGGETVVLLGDILDFWIFSKDDSQDYLIRRIYSEWVRLWNELKRLQELGTKLYYVPGNHDVFIFFIEVADRFPWGEALMVRSREMAALREMTKDMRMNAVADICYPFLQLPIGGKQVLFTHGHYQGWGWRLIGGIPDQEPGIALFLTTASIVMAHKYARLMRRTLKEGEWLLRVHGIEDTAISITNAVVNAFGGARLNMGASVENVLDVIKKAIQIFFCGKSDVTLEEEIQIRDALLSLSQIQGEHMPTDMKGIWDNTMKFLSKAVTHQNVHLVCSGSNPRLLLSNFSEFTKSNRLVFGHHHKPRESEPAYDVGGFVGPIMTNISILNDGSINRDLPPFPRTPH